MHFIEKVALHLEKNNVPYAIVGGHAVAFHGWLRGTVDVDFVIRWTLKSLQKAQGALESLGLVSRLPIDAESVFHFRDEYIQKKNLIAWNFYNPQNPLEQVDLIINYDLKNHKTTRMKTNYGSIKILSLEDLIKMKEKSGRPQDLEDIKALKNL